MPSVWINGTFIDESSATVSVRDTGLLHGIGVFTTMRARDGKVIRLTRHLARIRQSCDELAIPLLYTGQELEAAASELLRTNTLSESRLRLTITRGTTVNDPVQGLNAQPTAILTAAAFEPYPTESHEKGLTVVVLDKYKLNPYDITAGHKTLDYFARLAALREASSHGAAEALWFNVHNYLQSGSISNVFIVKNGSLLTPPTNPELLDPAVAAKTAYPRSNVLPGTTRGAVIDQANSAGINVRLGTTTINDLLDADEVFITNSVMGVMPVTHIERKSIAAGKPGPITSSLASLIDGEV